MSDKSPKQKIDDILTEVYVLLEKATSIAEDHQISFEFKPETLGTYEPRHIIWEASSSCEWETSDEWAEGRWTHEHFDWYASTC